MAILKGKKQYTALLKPRRGKKTRESCFCSFIQLIWLPRRGAASGTMHDGSARPGGTGRAETAGRGAGKRRGLAERGWEEWTGCLRYQ